MGKGHGQECWVSLEACHGTQQAFCKCSGVKGKNKTRPPLEVGMGNSQLHTHSEQGGSHSRAIFFQRPSFLGMWSPTAPRLSRNQVPATGLTDKRTRVVGVAMRRQGQLLPGGLEAYLTGGMSNAKAFF